MPNGTSLFAGTSDGNGASAVYRSTDSGFSWTLASTGIGPLPAGTDAGVNALALNGTTLFAGTSEGGGSGHIYRSTDNGMTWARTNSENGSVFAFAALGTNLFAGVYFDNVLRSTDNGTNWTVTKSGIAASRVFALVGNQNNLFAGTDSGIFRSSDNGTNWTSAGVGLTPATEVYALTVSNSNLFAGTSVGVFRSTDNGATWKQTSSTNAFALAVSGTNLFAGGEYVGVYRTSDEGANWQTASNGITLTSVNGLAVIGANLIANTDFNGAYRSSDNGTSWALTSAVIPGFITTIGTNLIGFNGSSGFFLSTDGGINWKHTGAGPTNTVRGLVASDNNLFAIFSNFETTFGDSIFRSSDNGATWIAASAGLAYIESYLGVSGGNLFTGAGKSIYRSTDNGASWAQVESSGATVRSVVDFGAAVLVGTDHGIIRSTDNGNTWGSVVMGIPDTSVSTFLADGPHLFANTASGIFFSSDTGANWNWVGSGLPPNILISNLAANAQHLFAGTVGAGVWRRPLSDFGISSVSPHGAPSAGALSIFPNPASDRATIGFTAPSAGYADVRIVNELGAEVARVFSGEVGAGEHSWVWNVPANICDGLYECVVRMNGEARERPIVFDK